MAYKLSLKLTLNAVALLFMLSACSSAQYAVMEKFGIHKREILVDRVEDARDSQQQAKEQFASALEEFSAVLGFQGGSLEEKYKQLKAELDQSEERAEDVRERIDKVEDVAEALFDEWEDELGLYSSDSLRRSSAKKLKETRGHYQRLMAAMRRAESKIDPVLVPLRDQVLFLKHNLNAQAIASLKTELGRVEGDVSLLIREMESSIHEADVFISRMEKT
jgi:chromosome segregation ATPase